MKLAKATITIWPFALAAAFWIGCAAKRNFTSFLAREIGALGGRTNRFDRAQSLYGSWKIRRDEFGAAIDVKGIQFETITNLLTRMYGTPQFYCPATRGHGPIYLYPLSEAGISIFVAGTERGAEVTLAKLLEFHLD